jgi:S1-C subfamily serine protease
MIALVIPGCGRNEIASKAPDPPSKTLTAVQIDDRVRPATVAVFAQFGADGDTGMSSLGTGFIVTPDGYILTNAHVVEPHEGGTSLQSVHVIFPTARGEGSSAIREVAAEVMKIGSPTPGPDIAVLKIEGDDLPTVPLADNLDDAGIRTGAEIYVIGYPGSVALAPEFIRSNGIQSSMTVGHVSAVKDLSEGWQVIQIDAAVNPGNSGGPVLNDRGEVVGLATFQIVGTQGVNFAEAIGLARQFLRDLNVRPSESDFTRQYYRALEEYEQPGHGNAFPLFQELARTHPNEAAPREFLRELGHPAPVPKAQDHVERARPIAKSMHRVGPAIAFLGIGLLAVIVLLIIIGTKR